MPPMITRSEREQLMSDGLGGLGRVCADASTAIGDRDWKGARNARPQFEAMFSALDTLGWHENPEDTRPEDSTPPLALAFRAPGHEALGLLADAGSALATGLRARVAHDEKGA